MGIGRNESYIWQIDIKGGHAGCDLLLKEEKANFKMRYKAVGMVEMIHMYFIYLLRILFIYSSIVWYNCMVHTVT